MYLEKILEKIEFVKSNDQNPNINSMTLNSKKVNKDSLFFAIKGFKKDGNDFIQDAYNRGCRVFVTEKNDIGLNNDVQIIRVKNARSAFANAAAAFYDYPHNKLFTIAITGTNGKTTVSYLVDSIFKRKYNNKSNILGTIRHIINGNYYKAFNTTPESIDIFNYMDACVKGNGKHFVMEVSSHALKLNRIEGVDFDRTIYTNISRDHMDFHENENDYVNSKFKLFREHTKKNGYAIINIDDAKAAELEKDLKIKKITYAINNKNADIYPVSIDEKDETKSIFFKTPNGKINIRTQLVGRFNIYNIMAAVAAAVSDNITEEDIVQGIYEIKTVPGRFENVQLGQHFKVIIDYAHTPDALENVLKQLRKITPNKVITVFGCGGDRDRGKRALMGQISGGLSDIVFVTSDNPRTEDPDSIIDDILKGFDNKKNCIVISDRYEAIKEAIKKASKEDSILIAGKGHEDYQIIGNEKRYFSDKKVAEKIIKELWL